MEREHLTFHQLALGIGTGKPPSPAWHLLVQCPLVVFVGVTGVGKSTTLDQLSTHVSFRLLPNRRILTDDLIIGYLQQVQGKPIQPITDRAERFEYTRRYRELFPGGMGHALSQLVLEQAPEQEPWFLFDGLRGVNEVRAACMELPQARFVVLDAPDVVRVQRLLGRGDSFDQVALAADPLEAGGEVKRFVDIGLAEADTLFTASEVVTLLACCTPPVGQGNVAVNELLAKLKIVVEERRNYDPTATVNTLQELAPNRTLVIDTTEVSAKGAAAQIAHWLS